MTGTPFARITVAGRVGRREAGELAGQGRYPLIPANTKEIDVATLRSMTIENFKAIGEPVKIEFKPITLLFGPNSAGKSTIIQALIYAREIFVNRNLDPYQCEVRGEQIDLGGIRALMHDHDLKGKITLELELALDNQGLPNITDDGQLGMFAVAYDGNAGPYLSCIDRARSVSVGVSVRWDNNASRPFIETYRVGINNELFCEITDFLLDDTFRPVDEARIDSLLQELRSLPSDELTSLVPLVKELSAKPGRISARVNLKHSLFCADDKNEGKTNYLMTLANSLIQNPECWQPKSDGPSKFGGGLCVSPWESALPNWESHIFLGEPCEDSSLRGIADNSVFDEIIYRAVVGPGRLVRDCLKELRYLGPLRAIPPRVLEQSQLSQETGVSSGFSTCEELFGVDDHTLDAINHWMKGPEQLNSGYAIERKRYRELDGKGMAALKSEQAGERERVINELSAIPERVRLSLRKADPDMELSFRDIGTGISQVMPVVIAALVSRNQIVAIEQPELHIHPALQVKLGDLFISRIKDSGCLFLLETHSEHLLLRIMRRMRETSQGRLPGGIPPVIPEDVIILYVELDGTRTIVREMPLNKRGELVKAWPGGFFEEDFKELF